MVVEINKVMKMNIKDFHEYSVKIRVRRCTLFKVS